MKISYNWLKSYIDTDLPAEKLSEILTDTGLEVEKLEEFESVPGGLKGVVVGHVISTEKHPDADKLKLTQVDIGTGETVQIVCGAPNVAAGQKVLVATVGTTLYPKDGQQFEIKRAKIRGKESLGMICAEDELGIGQSHDGIMVLLEGTQTGMSAADYLGMETDHVFEIGLTPNRTDAFGHFGVARDIAARLSLDKTVQAKLPKLADLKIDEKAEAEIDVEITDKDGCGRYSGLLIKNVKVSPSPTWLQNRLRSIGLSPINNIVDITNFVQHETGQPLHAFDADKIESGKVVIRTLAQGTGFTTLDGVERKLDAQDLMITNGKKGLCIAGVFGGEASGVTGKTDSVFLESAWFNPVRIRKTAKRHGLNTDASFRFERGVDPYETVYSLKRAAQMIMEIAGGKINGPLIDVIAGIPEKIAVSFRLQRFNALAGTELSASLIKSILVSLGFEITSSKDDVFELLVPGYRADVTREIDVIEEVLRIYGYNNVEMPARMSLSISESSKPERHEVIKELGALLVGRGFSEMVSNGLTRSDYILNVMGAQSSPELIAMLNPLSQELDVLRPNLVVSALESVAHNLNRQADRLMLFEIGKAYSKIEGGYKEVSTLCLTLCGSRFSENWNNAAAALEGSDLRGHVKAVFDGMGLSLKFGETFQDPFYENGIAIMMGRKIVGRAGYIAKKALKIYGVKRDVLVAEIDLDICVAAMRHADKQMRALPKFPSVRRDLSLLLDEKIAFGEIEKIAFAKAGKLVKEVNLFDVYEGKNLPEGKKSYAVSFMLQDIDKTLNDKLIDKVMGNIQRELETALGASLR